MKRAILIPLVLAIAVAACSSAGGSTGTSATMPTTTAVDEHLASTTPEPTSSSGSGVIPPQLAGWQIEEVLVGDRTMRLAIADSPTLRAQGLMEVTDLGDLDGMLFYWRHEAHGGFHMENTVIPLDIVWFLEDGTYADRTSMLPCEVEDCPIYTPRGGVDYRYAIEANPGDLDWIDESTVIVYSD